MIFGIAYSPVASSFAVNWRSTAGTFIDEFQLMLAMYMNRTSTGYGSPLAALLMTICISPWAAMGASHEYALSMRCGVPSASTSRSSGDVVKPSGGPPIGVFGLIVPGLPNGFSGGGGGFGNGAL